MKPEIMDENKVLNILYSISSLTLPDFRPEDNIIKSIKEMLEAVVWNLGTSFDEMVDDKLKKTNFILHELEYKHKLILKLPIDLTSNICINNFFKLFINIPGIDPYTMNYTEMFDKCSSYCSSVAVSNEIKELNLCTFIEQNLGFIKNKKDEAYNASKTLLSTIRDRIDYNFTHNVTMMEPYCLESINFILFLLKYYAEINCCFINLIDRINLILEQNLHQCT